MAAGSIHANGVALTLGAPRITASCVTPIPSAAHQRSNSASDCIGERSSEKPRKTDEARDKFALPPPLRRAILSIEPAAKLLNLRGRGPRFVGGAPSQFAKGHGARASMKIEARRRPDFHASIALRGK